MEKQLSLFETSTPIQQNIGEQSPPFSLEKLPAYTAFIDGAARGNPGNAGAGIYILDQNGNIILKKGLFLYIKTNNQAEYLALLLATLLLRKKIGSLDSSHIKSITFISDSELLVKQMNGIYKVKNEYLKHIKSVVQSLCRALPTAYTHVLREQNEQADALANLGIDKKIAVPPDIKDQFRAYDIYLDS